MQRTFSDRLVGVDTNFVVGDAGAALREQKSQGKEQQRQTALIRALADHIGRPIPTHTPATVSPSVDLTTIQRSIVAGSGEIVNAIANASESLDRPGADSRNGAKTGADLPQAGLAWLRFGTRCQGRFRRMSSSRRKTGCHNRSRVLSEDRLPGDPYGNCQGPGQTFLDFQSTTSLSFG
jgi:hypothetical protein